jgi:hypothetical protein
VVAQEAADKWKKKHESRVWAGARVRQKERLPTVSSAITLPVGDTTAGLMMLTPELSIVKLNPGAR